MSYWVEIMCDTCGRASVGKVVQPGESFARRLDGGSEFRRSVGADGGVYHICPECAARRASAPQEGAEP